MTAMQKVAANPLSTLIAAIVLSGGIGAGSGFLSGGGNGDDIDSRLRAVESQVAGAASQNDVIELATKMDLMTEAFREMRAEFRELRRRPAP